MKVVFALATMILMLAAPAYAQSQASTMPTMEQMMDGKTPDQIEKEQATEKAYKESLKKIPDAKTSYDPWGSAHSGDAPKTVAKAPAAKKPPAKIGNSAN
jgi:hypothetical protein